MINFSNFFHAKIGKEFDKNSEEFKFLENALNVNCCNYVTGKSGGTLIKSEHNFNFVHDVPRGESLVISLSSKEEGKLLVKELTKEAVKCQDWVKCINSRNTVMIINNGN